MNVDMAGFTTGVLDAHSADAAQRETELRNRHQEQFNKLRARLRSLETESAIMSKPVLELRRRQQELLASKRYAEAFEHMKIIKAAEKEVMQAHREEHRRVNEESVRKLLEDQARERESLRKSLRGANARVQTRPRSPGAGERACASSRAFASSCCWQRSWCRSCRSSAQSARVVGLDQRATPCCCQTRGSLTHRSRSFPRPHLRHQCQVMPSSLDQSAWCPHARTRTSARHGASICRSRWPSAQALLCQGRAWLQNRPTPL